MVTFTFDLAALFVGLCIGLVLGTLITVLVEMRDGGAWSKGFNDGCYLKNAVKEMKDAAIKRGEL